MPIGPARMPLFEHLGELRMRLVRIVVVLFVAMCVFYLATPTIIHLLFEPISEYLPHDADGTYTLNVLDVFGSFTIRFKVALWASVVATMPIILWQILAFFLPALKPNERKWFIPTFAVAVVLFIAGTLFCYFLILNPAVAWLTDQASGYASIFPDAKAWVDVIINFEIAFGFAFELPLIVFYLVVFEIIPYAKLREQWRTVYIVLMVISAMVTLDASPVTMLLMFAALLMLYEVSLLIARLVLGNRVQKQKEEAAAEAAEEAEWASEWEKTRARIKERLGDDEEE
ncbi:Sec-independent protein translocase protein TatC [Slackia heliotrinireducens]|uniref:Sec-independent protein translocase protein TatC n=1 Tax=Slackia heliotrinireducens (strain ATCC 29202 / DSM 20476 / NCTC 11029 / RHS 1) TaxID=471855 RepID=C7N7W2_SLAHD|nr:twin-arginine translocase subunit TatC [Slackia heliotrinireducens]ACV22997.1 twin arginine targeting protein translocase subunit TatC [Slackia heliotrinireducens DSM 20476]VEH01887.1 Sec-independent protein translocase protein TatC [Slackia heliotrinireducens]